MSNSYALFRLIQSLNNFCSSKLRNTRKFSIEKIESIENNLNKQDLHLFVGVYYVESNVKIDIVNCCQIIPESVTQSLKFNTQSVKIFKFEGLMLSSYDTIINSILSNSSIEYTHAGEKWSINFNDLLNYGIKYSKIINK